ncbi:MAG: protein O-mannosyl-transferase family [Kiritimatiellia bacterium]
MQTKPFFRRVDWASFWTGTLVAFLVYFFTLGPSVGLEDSGELATAANALGVPHPPGYPIWTMICWGFCRLFDWVTFRGQPTPAYAVSLASAVAGALAAGITAMLITRSGSDMLNDLRGGKGREEEKASAFDGLFCWAGGVGGALAFAFSPVMWSQSTIVEVYSLGALFLMWVFLLTYQWMKAPRDKTLWLLAFVFGLGLTNYQVLLLAAVPLAFIIFMRNASLFRDFVLVAIPILLTAWMLQLGALPTAFPYASSSTPCILRPLVEQGARFAYPHGGLLVSGVVCLCLVVPLSLLVKIAASRPGSRLNAISKRLLDLQAMPLVVPLIVGAALIALSACFTTTLPVETSHLEWAPLMAPSTYCWIGLLVLVAIGLSAIGGLLSNQGRRFSDLIPIVVALGVVALVLLVIVGRIPTQSMPPSFRGPIQDWLTVGAVVVALLVYLSVASALTRGATFFAVAVAFVQMTAFLLLRKGVLLGLSHPSTWWFWWPVLWNFLLLGLALICLPNGRTVAATIFFSELGVSFYAYMPIVSDLRNPPMNWGYPRTWEGFKHAITRGQYEQISAQSIFTGRFLQQLGDYFTDVRVQFTLLVAPLAILPFSAWNVLRRNRKVRMLLPAVALFLLCALVVFIAELFQTEPLWRIDKYLMAGMVLLSAVGFVTIGLSQVVSIACDSWRDRKTAEGITRGLAIVGLVLGIGALASRILLAIFGISDGACRIRDWTSNVLLALLPTMWHTYLPAIVSVIALLLGFGLTFGALILAWKFLPSGRKTDADCVLHQEFSPLSRQWLIGTMLAFLVMSVMLIALANPTGDLQDYFIQKVKFISSHGLYSLWIGYGLILALSVGAGLCARYLPKWLRPACLGATLLALMVPLVPVWENFMNDHLVFKASAAEQNGHDYGWQFGNYQLRGADAIREELASDEEPLPNPLYPPAMTTNAVFFGGTDPGRFVPTYMIYAANVRPDVFLITQNALADGTYMSVERDLYGNQMWIPSADDSAKAFQIYVDEVNQGKRAANADLRVENGRVQVSGALGVMEINGILCRMMWEKNIDRHDFYLEESYVIPWMYPYLSPHGLIMKINAKETPLDRRTANADLDFWDWYLRRLTRDRKFRRDLVAQKSFSKLRCALAGLYANRGMGRESEIAFEQGRALYPVSPEANFRLVQEVLIPQNRLEEALRVLREFNARDPKNTRSLGLCTSLEEVLKARQVIATLAPKMGNGTIAPKELATLASAYYAQGDVLHAGQAYEQLLKIPNLAPADLCTIAQVLATVRRTESAATAIDRALKHTNLTPEQLQTLLQAALRVQAYKPVMTIYSRYLKLRPNDWMMWGNLAILYYEVGQVQYGHQALLQALKVGGEAALNQLSQVSQLKRRIPEALKLLQQDRSLAPALGPRRF